MIQRLYCYGSITFEWVTADLEGPVRVHCDCEWRGFFDSYSEALWAVEVHNPWEKA